MLFEDLIRRMNFRWVLAITGVSILTIWLAIYLLPVELYRADRTTLASRGTFSGFFGKRQLFDTDLIEDEAVGIRTKKAARMLQECQLALEKLLFQKEEWSRVAFPLADSDIGFRLTSDEENLFDLLNLLNDGLVTDQEFDALQAEFQELAALIQDALASTQGSDITGVTLEIIQALHTQIENRQMLVSAALSELNKRINLAADLPKSTLSLRQVIDRLRTRLADESLKNRLEAEATAYKEQKERFLAAERAKLEAETALKETELAAEAKRLWAEEEKARIAAAKQQEIDKQELAALQFDAEFERDLPEIHSLLSPFVTPAPYRLNAGYGLRASGHKTGVSLSEVTRTGALEPSEDGMEAMAKYGELAHRPLGTFPKYIKSEWKRSQHVRTRIMRAQELMRKYGQAMIDRGLLEK